MRDIIYSELKDVFMYNPLTGSFFWKKSNNRKIKTGDKAGTKNKISGYVCLSHDNKKFLAHRVAWFLHYGREAVGELDHKNRDRSDNRIFNLREVTSQENKRNLGLQNRNKSGIKGVFYIESLDKFKVTIGDFGNTNLGTFGNIFDAACARLSAENRLWGEK